MTEQTKPHFVDARTGGTPTADTKFVVDERAHGNTKPVAWPLAKPAKVENKANDG